VPACRVVWSAEINHHFRTLEETGDTAVVRTAALNTVGKIVTELRERASHTHAALFF